ncbi:bifunctional diaminohydroxyphosphoribosylaminopyrimidine deaminase/5-amino-6-(5-phosphoribosylamino)uracil reductase RibD [Buchnera aphidicola]|uniref:bifunctional diaminohydroxyphosphoribosylaminopyrimidine deaminase/5-amino-6-(5-phosphoribosylamino)uracil reductase RibD n=1 Tax=Buchnera aphidicola TaxID=9 RepID=UPI0031B73CE5
MKDIFYMKKAINLAKLGMFTTFPNPNVGCIIVKKSKIVGKGWHKKSGEEHAEIYALKQAKKKAKGATAYITLEPCCHYGKTPPCCKALFYAGISKVVIASKDPNPKVNGLGLLWLKKRGILIKEGVLKDEAKYINQGFFKRMKTGIPWIQLKLAMSIDGRSSLQNGKSKWITSKKSRIDVQYFRAKSNAILSTSKTILNDNPSLNIRYHEFNDKKLKKYDINKKNQPIRIIIDSKNRLTPSNKFIYTKGNIILVRLKYDNLTWPKNVKQLLVPSYKKKIDLHHLFKILGKSNINTIWIESGPSLSGALLKYKLIDELIIYIAPKLFGHHSNPLCLLDMYSEISEVPKLSFSSIQKIDSDIRIILKPNNNLYN